MENVIQKVLYTLGLIEIKGRENIDRMLGCMQALEKVADALKHNRETLGEAQQDRFQGEDGVPGPQTTQQEGGDTNGSV